MAGWLDPLTLGLLWPFALIWASTRPGPGRFAVQIQLEVAIRELTIPAGSLGAAAVYTQRGKALRIVRRVVIRMTTWLSCVILQLQPDENEEGRI